MNTFYSKKKFKKNDQFLEHLQKFRHFSSEWLLRKKAPVQIFSRTTRDWPKQINSHFEKNLRTTLFTTAIAAAVAVSLFFLIDELWKRSFCDRFGILIEFENAIVINSNLGKVLKENTAIW